MDDKLAATLAALNRGEKPVCPACGAEWMFKVDEPACIGAHWMCGAELCQGRESPFADLSRHDDCYEAQIAALQSRLIEQVTISGNNYDSFRLEYRKNQAQAAEVERLREALYRYGKHEYDCKIMGMRGSCTCGYDSALRGGKDSDAKKA